MNIDTQYKELCEHILRFGVQKSGKNPESANKSIFGWQLNYNMTLGQFPLLTTKKMSLKNVMTELIWFLRGDTNIKYLIDNNCHIWDGDAYKTYSDHIDKQDKLLDDAITIYSTKTGYVKDKEVFREIKLSKEEFIDKIKTDNEFAKRFGELGPIYGKQWRGWGSYTDKIDLVDGGRGNIFYARVSWPGIDQIQNLINDLKTNPDSRRLMVNAWSVGELDKMVLPPCHYGFQVWTRELSLEERFLIANKINKNIKQNVYSSRYIDELNIPKRAISLMWNQRSVDVFLGLPYNIASYGLLLEILAQHLNMVPESLIGNLGDCHIYDQHISAIQEQLQRSPKAHGKLSRMDIVEHETIDNLVSKLHQLNSQRGIYVEGYDPHPAIKANMISQV